MEIHKGTIPQVKFYLPTGVTSATAQWKFNDGTLTTITSTEVDGVSTVTLPYMQSEGVVTVAWSFTVPITGNITETVTYDVVTPYLTIREVKEIWDTATDAEATRLEANIRYIINAHTGQSFGKYVGSYTVRGDDNAVLQLPARLIALDTVNGVVANNYFTLDGDGYVLRHYPYGVPPVKADYWGLHQHVGGVIHNPNGVRIGNFWSSMTYELDGIWGWSNVPEPIKEAARLLVNDYACADSQYRDRYLVSMTAADWRIQFANGAYAKTGNVRADQLLNQYVLKRGWAVI